MPLTYFGISFFRSWICLTKTKMESCPCLKCQSKWNNFTGGGGGGGGGSAILLNFPGSTSNANNNDREAR